MVWVRWTIGILNVAMFAALLVLLDAQGASLIGKGAWEYKDLIAILLSVVSVILTFIGLIIAVAAIWGFQTIRGMAEAKAIETSKLGSAEYLKSMAFKADLKGHIDEAIRLAAKEAIQDALTTTVLRADTAPEHHTKDEAWRD